MAFNKFIEDLDKLESLSYDNMAILNIKELILPEKQIFKKLISKKFPEIEEDDLELMAEAYGDENSEDEKDEDDFNDDDFTILSLFSLLNDDYKKDDDDDDETKEERKERKDKEVEEKRKAKDERRKAKDERREVKEEKKDERRKSIESGEGDFKRMREEREDKQINGKKKRLEELKDIYKDRFGNLKEEIKNNVNEILSAVYLFFNKYKELVKSLALSTIKTITFLPGVAIMIAAPPWNIPGAITTLLLVMVGYLEIISKIQSIVPFMQPLRDIPSVVDEKNLIDTSIILDTITLKLIDFYIPILGLRKFINDIINFIKSLFGEGPSDEDSSDGSGASSSGSDSNSSGESSSGSGGNNAGNSGSGGSGGNNENRNKEKKDRRPKIFKQATKKLIKLGHIESVILRPVNIVVDDDSKLVLRKKGNHYPAGDEGNPSIYDIYSYDEEDIEEIISLLDQYKIRRTKKWGGRQHVWAYASNTDNLLKQVKDLENKINDIDDGLPKDIDTSEFDQFVYDITLPDGTVIPNISEEGLEYYKNKFEVLIKNDTSVKTR